VLADEPCAGELPGDTVVVDGLLPSSPPKLRLRYRFAASLLDTMESCEPSALLARLCPGRIDVGRSLLSDGVSCVEFAGVVC
jgi:hypothetical protein